MQPYTPYFLFNQAHRTAPTRQYLYSLADLNEVFITLDLGCGTGIITSELASFTEYTHAIGIDINPQLITKAKEHNPGNEKLHWVLCDALALPLRSSILSFVLSHFTLMWILELQQVLTEIYRILKPSALFTIIEPDYSGRIEVSTNVRKHKHFPITDWLIRKGANPFIGGKLPAELSKASFSEITYGVLSWEYHAEGAREEIQDEADLLQVEGIHWEQPLFTYTPIFWIKGRKA